jgi:hypothetical protein
MSDQFPSTHFRAYGLGWELRDYQGVKMVAHGGGYDGMYSRVVMIPEKNLGAVVLTNSMTSIPSALSFYVVDHCLEREPRDWSAEMLKSYRRERDNFYRRIDNAVQPVADAGGPSRPLTAYVGTYSCPMYGDAEVLLEDDHLVLRLVPYPALVADLTHLHFDTFVLKWRNESAWFDEGTVQFVADPRGRFVRLNLDVPNDDLWFHELRLSRVPEN